MSDDEEYDYDYGSDAGSMGDDGSGDEGGEGGNMKIQVENAFYEAQDHEVNNPEEAIRLFEEAVQLDTELETAGEVVQWRFKALQHLVALHFQMQNYTEMLSKYQRMLNDMALPSVTKNECTEGINTILETISTCADDAMLVQMFEITLTALQAAGNERLLFNTKLKLAKLYLNDESNAKNKEFEQLLVVMKQSCSRPDGSDDPTKASNLLEIYCLEITFCRMTNDSNRMREVFPRTLQLKAAVEDPRIMGVIHEEGGKMHLSGGHWDDACIELGQAFRKFQEAGHNARAKQCLKYVALASMLSTTALNPFDTREAKVFINDPEIKAMSDLRTYLQENDLKRFERVLHEKRNGISTEPVLMKYITPLRTRMHEHVLLNLVKPYKKCNISFLSTELSMTPEDIESMLVTLIQQGDLHASIDQIRGVVVLGDGMSSAGTRSRNVGTQKSRALAKWADALVHVSNNLVAPVM